MGEKDPAALPTITIQQMKKEHLMYENKEVQLPPIRKFVKEYKKNSYHYPFGKFLKREEELQYFWNGKWEPVQTTYELHWI